MIKVRLDTVAKGTKVVYSYSTMTGMSMSDVTHVRLIVGDTVNNLVELLRPNGVSVFKRARGGTMVTLDSTL